MREIKGLKLSCMGYLSVNWISYRILGLRRLGAGCRFVERVKNK